MTLFKTSFFTGLLTLLRLSSSFIIAKVLAIYVGPAGFAVMGQFQNFVQIVQTFAGGMVQSGVVKYTAEYSDDTDKKAKILGAGVRLSVALSLLLGVLILIWHKWLSLYLFHSDQHGFVLVLFAVTLLFFVFNSLLMAMINGERDIKWYSVCNASSVLLGLVSTIVLVKFFSLNGALCAAVLSTTIGFFTTISLVYKRPWFKLSNFIQRPDWQSIKCLMTYGLMLIVSSLMVPVVQFLLRSFIVGHFTWQGAGYWQATTRISDLYLMVITSTLSVYYLPKLSALKNNTDIKKEIIYGYKRILPIVIVLALCVYIAKVWIVEILFTPEFFSMLPLFKFQLIGDVLKIGSWLLGYVLVARAIIKWFILTEIIFGLSYYVFAVVFSHFYGLEGVTLAFAVNYALYWIVMALIAIKVLKD